MLRRHLWRWLIVAMLAMTATAAAAPADASAVTCLPSSNITNSCMGYQTAGVNHKGWVYLNLNYCPPGALCRMSYRESIDAWHWTGTRWTQSSVKGGWVYVYPYSGQWRWVWTQASGWVALDSGRFEIRPY
jgi:hypothetical protein